MTEESDKIIGDLQFIIDQKVWGNPTENKFEGSLFTHNKPPKYRQRWQAWAGQELEREHLPNTITALLTAIAWTSLNHSKAGDSHAHAYYMGYVKGLEHLVDKMKEHAVFNNNDIIK